MRNALIAKKVSTDVGDVKTGCFEMWVMYGRIIGRLLIDAMLKKVVCPMMIHNIDRAL